MSELILHLWPYQQTLEVLELVCTATYLQILPGLVAGLQLGTEDSVFPGDGEVGVQKWSSVSGRVEEDTYCGTIVDTFNIF